MLERPGGKQVLYELLLEQVRLEQVTTSTAILLIAESLGIRDLPTSEAWRRLRNHSRANLSDSLLAEFVLMGIELSIFPSEILNCCRPLRSLEPSEIHDLLNSRAKGSKRYLARVLCCDRSTVRRWLRLSAKTRSDLS
jgi:hypothetical protein